MDIPPAPPAWPPGLPDTPAWSPSRRRLVLWSWSAGLAMVVAGAAMAWSGRGGAIAGDLVTWGVGQMCLVTTAYIGGASGERWAAWSAVARRGGPT